MCFGKFAFLWILWDTFCIQDLLAPSPNVCEEAATKTPNLLPIASMCYHNQASGTTVILDVFKANEVSASECTCFVTISLSNLPQSKFIFSPHFDIQPKYKYCDSRIEVKSSLHHVSQACTIGGRIDVYNNETISFKFYKEGDKADDRYCIILGLEHPGTVSVKCIDPLATEQHIGSHSSVRPDVNVSPSTKVSIDPSLMQTSTKSSDNVDITSSISTEQISTYVTHYNNSMVSPSSTTQRTTSLLTSFFTSLVTKSKSTETSTQQISRTSAIASAQLNISTESYISQTTKEHQTESSIQYTSTTTSLFTSTTAADPTSSDAVLKETPQTTAEVSSFTSSSIDSSSSSNLNGSNKLSTSLETSDTTPIFVTFIPTSTEKQISSATPDPQAKEPKKEGPNYRFEVIIPAAVASVAFIVLFIVLILCARHRKHHLYKF